MIDKKYLPPKGLIKGALRRIFVRTVLHREVIDSALSVAKGVRGGKQYDCAICKEHFGIAKVIVDHIEPVVPLDKTIHDMSFNDIVSRMWCDIKNLWVLCKECHKVKSKEERQLRKKIKNGEVVYNGDN